MRPRADIAAPVLACGEVRTCLLPAFQALDSRTAAQLLRLRADERVRVSERPNLYALSPDVLTGVDCPLPTANGARVRAVGTVAARAALTEGVFSRPRPTSGSRPRDPTYAGRGGTTSYGPEFSNPSGSCPKRRSWKAF